jgi:hypothetical protein
MPNWKSEEEYTALTDELDEPGWAWEFLRRNPEYCKDYQLAEVSAPKKTGPAWLVVAPGGEEPLSWKLGKKWQISGPIRDPKNNDPPLFMAAYPREPHLDGIAEFFADTDKGGSTPQSSDFATLVFDLRRQLVPQIKRATERLNQRQALIAVQKSPHKGSEKWPLYLRLLDAKRAGASTAEIIATIETYAHLGNEAADGYAADKAVAANLKAASLLLRRALTILK